MNFNLIDLLRDEDDKDPSFIRITRNILLFVIAVNIALLLLVSGLIYPETKNQTAAITLYVVLILDLISLIFLFRRNALPAKLVIPLALIVAITIISLGSNGLKNPGVVGLPVVLVIAFILQKRRALILTTPFVVLATIIISIADLNGYILESSPTQVDDTVIVPAILLSAAGIIQLLTGRLEENIQRAKRSEQKQAEENRELTELQSTLEMRVNQRTEELASANQSISRRARQLEGIIQVSKAATSADNLQDTLSKIAQVISQQLGFYHVGIFLNDAATQYAVLTAANSDGGKTMLKRGHQLKIGEQGIVGYVTGTGVPRIALDVGEDSAYFNNPDLSLTHSEMALPLRSGDQVIGALDIQSTEHGAFSQEDIEVLGALADQVSLTIQNTRLLDQTRKLLSESEAIQRQYLRSTWSQLPGEQKLAGYKYTVAGAVPLDQAALEQEAAKYKVEVPITLRGESIGALAVHIPAKEKVSADQMDLIRAIADRVALSAENARLFDETQKRALQLESLNEMGRAISQEIELRPVLKTSYDQLKRIIPVDAYIIALLDEQSQNVYFPLVIDEDIEYHNQPPVSVNPETSTGKVLLTGQPILTLLNEQEYLSERQQAGMLGNKNRPSASLMYVPLTIGQKTTGVLSIQSYIFNAYTQDQLTLVENIANQLSIAIQNARLFEDANRRAERERIITEITAKIGTSVRTESILKTAAQELNQILNGAEVLIKLGTEERG